MSPFKAYEVAERGGKVELHFTMRGGTPMRSHRSLRLMLWRNGVR
jgi:hypothetical protein